MFYINPIFDTAISRKAAERIAQGTKIVRRDANPERSYGFTFEHLAKLGPINAVHLQDLICCFRAIIGDSQAYGKAYSDNVHESSRGGRVPNRFPFCTVLGLTESGIVPSFAMQKACESFGIDSKWCCSSRVDTGGLKFCESHSHAPEHFLPRRLLGQLGEELWVVEDEVTTGRTIGNLLECLYDSSNIRKCRVFSLLDAREDTDHERLKQICLRRRWNVTFQSILRPENSSCLSNRPHGFTNRINHVARHYVVGESIAAALPLLLSGDIQYLQHITLSPWVIDGDYIVSRQSWQDCYYIYNAPEDESKQVWNEEEYA